MKQIIVFIFTLLSFLPVATAHNYYKGKDTLKVCNITYKVDIYYGNTLALENINNTLLKELPYDTEQHRYISLAEGPVICPDQEQMKSVVASILNPNSLLQDIRLNILLAVDTKTLLVKEVSFSFSALKQKRNIMSLPPELIWELENRLVGHSFGFVTPDYFMSANYLRGVYSYEF